MGGGGGGGVCQNKVFNMHKQREVLFLIQFIVPKNPT